MIIGFVAAITCIGTRPLKVSNGLDIRLASSPRAANACIFIIITLILEFVANCSISFKRDEL